MPSVNTHSSNIYNAVEWHTYSPHKPQTMGVRAPTVDPIQETQRNYSLRKGHYRWSRLCLVGWQSYKCKYAKHRTDGRNFTFYMFSYYGPIMPFFFLKICVQRWRFGVQALRFYGSQHVTVSGITFKNSAQSHLKFDNCVSVQVFDINISSPGDSPNTDGIHLQNSEDVVIYRANIASGNFQNSIVQACTTLRPVAHLL